MTITNDMRMVALQKISPSLQEAYRSVETARLLKVLMTENGIQNFDFVDLVGDVMLGFYSKSQLRSLLMQQIGLSEEVASNVDNKLRIFFSRVEGVPIASPEAREVKERLEFRPEPPVGPLGRKPLTREEVLRAIAPRRTMQSDIESVKQSKGPGAA
ncbi:MAG TPA: hypothetical protein VFS75_01630 [Candidatus Paceibacterota bacterium]|nr:hypothetical protein [Candidatus Paceibacterota bacterium]